MYFTGVFLLPWKLIAIPLILSPFIIFMKILNVTDINEEVSTFKDKARRYVSKKVFRACSFFIYSVFWIRDIKVKISDFDKDYPDYSERKNERPPMVIGNHASPIDFLMMGEDYACSLVCNEMFTKLPVIGSTYLTTY